MLNTYCKTLAVILCAMAPLATAGTPTIHEPATPITLVQKCEPGPWGIELSGGYAFAGRTIEPAPIVEVNGKPAPSNDDSPKVNLITTDLTGVYHFNEHHAVTLRFGFGTGTKSGYYGGDSLDRFHVNLFTLMPGYRFTAPLAGRWSGFVGVNVGIANESVKAKQTVDDIYPPELSYKKTDFDNRVHTSAYGFAYSAELGVRYAISKRVDLFAAYQFSGNTARPTRSSFYHGPNPVNGKKLDSQIYHGIRAGISYEF